MSGRYYQKREYSGNLSGFGVGIAFIIVGVASLVLNQLEVDFMGLRYWGYWMFVPAFFILLGAVGQLSTDKRIKRDVMAALRSRQPGNYTLDEIAAEAGVKRQHLLNVLMDLRSEGYVQYSYDIHSGEIILGSTVPYDPDPEFKPLSKDEPIPKPEEIRQKNFCVFCGHKIENRDAMYCPNCGSQL